MLQQSLLHLHRRDPLSATAKHVVGASCEPEITVCIRRKLISGVKPLSPHALGAQLLAVPIARCRAPAMHDQISDNAFWNVISPFVDDAQFVAIYRLSRAPRSHSSRT